MRVVLWGELYWPYIGGAELFAARLMRALRARGYEFLVITSHDTLDLPDVDRFEDIPIHRFHFRAALQPGQVEEHLRLRRRVATFLHSWAPDVVHVNGVTPSSFYCLQAVRTHPVPLLVRLNRELLPHQSPHRRGTLLEHALLRANWVTTVSQLLQRQACAFVPDIAARSSVIYNGVDTAAQQPAPACRSRILCLGRMVTDKGFDIAIDAFAALQQRRSRHPDLRLIIAGDGPERAALEERARARGVAAAIDFIGWVAPDDVPSLIAGADLMLMPSREDGLPNVALQAAAQAVPIVCTATGGLPEVVLHGETGLVADATPIALAAAMAELLADPVMARRLGVASWRRARTVFDPRRCIDAYDTLYRRLAGAAQ